MGALKTIFWFIALIVASFIGSIFVVAIPWPLVSHLENVPVTEVILAPMDLLLCLAFVVSLAVLLWLFLEFVFVPLVIKVQES